MHMICANKEGVFLMDEKAREARRAYKREWNRRNKDKVKAAQERYWIRKAEADRRTESEKVTG